MKTGEIIRVIVLSLFGAFLMFYVQPLIYRQGLLYRPSDVQNPESLLQLFASGDYMNAAVIVFFVSALATILWCNLATKSKANKMEEISSWRLFWWLLGLVPVLSIGVAIAMLPETHNEARLSLALFFALDILIVFWLTTTTSTPGLLMYIPPLSLQIRNFLAKFGITE